MWRLTSVAAAAALALSGASAADVEAADAAAALADEVCDANDEECALSLRQLRTATLKTEEADVKEAEVARAKKAGVAHVKKAAATSKTAKVEAIANKTDAEAIAAEAAAALERRAAGGGMGAKFTSLVESFTGKGGVNVYHQTSPEIAAMIMHGGFKPGSRGWCGGAIYFAQSPKATFTKAIGTDSHTGVILQAHVDPGHICKMDKKCDQSMTAAKAHAKGCDTIEFNPGDGNEFVVYDSRRIRNIKPIWAADHATAMVFSDELSKDASGVPSKDASARWAKSLEGIVMGK